MIILGIDAPQGWCCLDVDRGRGKLLGLGSLDDGREADELTGYIARFRPAIIVIERAMKVYAHGRGDAKEAHIRREVAAGLIATAEVAGEMKHACRIAGIRCTMTDADTIRRAMGIKGKDRTEKDRSVASVIGIRVSGWPARTNTHERDAALAALWGQIPMSAPVYAGAMT
jgi:hypothetical protein